jgi:hypothetical protein
MKRKALPLGAIILILVVALAAIGLSYSLWSETLTISGTVHTGEVDVEFSTYPPQECVDIWDVGECLPEPPEKEQVANCTVEWLGPDQDSEGDDGFDQLVVTVNGMYPSWHCKVQFDVTSTGSVPVHVRWPDPTDDIPEWIATDFEACYPEGVQLHQGQSTEPCTIDIHFTNEQAPPEGSGPYTFGWTILAEQWTEAPVPEPDVITVESATLNFGPTGWGGWSCPSDHPNVVGGTTDCTLPLANSLAWEPGASVDGFTYPTTPFGYTYSAGEEGWIVQNGGTGQSCKIYVDCAAP